MILFFDTETTGKPRNYKAPVTDLDNWPRIIQLAWMLCKDDGSRFDHGCHLIKPDGWEIPKEKFWIDNGYSTEKSLAEGFSIKYVLEQFLTPLNACHTMVAHNLDFDQPILAAEMIRAGIRTENKPKKICSMKISTEVCCIPGPYGYKWPSLTELHQFLFNEGFSGAHDAMNDVSATARCYFAMKNRQLI